MVDHPVILGGAALNGSRATDANAPPVILKRTDRNFIPAILKGLASDRQALAATQVSPFVQPVPNSPSEARDTDDTGNVLKLFQPVHQVYYVALVQISCNTFGTPRLDPAKIDSAGLVVRRVSLDDPSGMERWSKQKEKIKGWVPCSGPDLDLDPDPACRRLKASSGNLEIDSRLPIPTSPYAPFSETVTPLFVAPPDVCQAAKATVLYGLIPVTSVERSEVLPSLSYDLNFVRGHMPYFLRSDKPRSLPKRVAGQSLDKSILDDEKSAKSITWFLNILRQLRFELNAFSDAPEGAAIFQALNQFTTKDKDGKDLANLGDFLKSASDIFVDQKDGQIQMPAQWPDINEDQSATFAALVQTAMESHARKVISGEGRYEDVTRQYCLRAFVRVKRPDGCPPALVWTAPSKPFVIAPWYDNAGLPPVKINLPDVSSVKQLKPNVAFGMPADLFNKLQKDAKKTLKGEDSAGGSSLGITWICSFSIPIITICAFLVLNIFLSLFDLFFSWMLWIKICIPIPIPKKKSG